ncbi:hypothetical protein GJV85_11095 [Sulfurimonas aquatica]|uniref:Uncharacterized protein n=1 Tax=Sulfurimonas aquatica TaxID=2672570 RepID=A0A975B1Y7_9BACT|nr:hypothetical protein [Sulfurimonas aquatica]QSZ42630.1 hypothetical protein GJV85_11095 [Sulfurimonas aquatica]
MKFSYINPRKKSALTQDVQLLLTFFTITLIMLFSTYAFLLYKNYSFNENKKNILLQREALEVSLDKMKVDIAYIEKQKIVAERIYTQNTVLKDSISNLFDLVPLRITLSEAQLLKNGLILYGITPNKDVYNFMLQAPLRSIFHKTYSSFYPAENGWIRFMSTNYMNEDEVKYDKEQDYEE